MKDKDTLEVQVNALPTLSISPTSTAICSGNTSTLTVTGANTYLWNTVPAQTTATASNLPIGTYTVTIQNGIGCTITSTVTITSIIINTCSC